MVSAERRQYQLLVENTDTGLWRVTSDDGFVHVVGLTLQTALRYTANILDAAESDSAPEKDDG